MQESKLILFSFLQGEIRLAKLMEPGPESSAPSGIGSIPRWHHVDCFIENREELEVAQSVTAQSFTGFKQLKKEDQKMLQEELGSSSVKKASKGKKRKGQADEEAVPKKVKKTAEEEEEERQLKVLSILQAVLYYPTTLVQI